MRKLYLQALFLLVMSVPSVASSMEILLGGTFAGALAGVIIKKGASVVRGVVFGTPEEIKLTKDEAIEKINELTLKLGVRLASQIISDEKFNSWFEKTKRNVDEAMAIFFGLDPKVDDNAKEIEEATCEVLALTDIALIGMSGSEVGFWKFLRECRFFERLNNEEDGDLLRLTEIDRRLAILKAINFDELIKNPFQYKDSDISADSIAELKAIIRCFDFLVRLKDIDNSKVAKSKKGVKIDKTPKGTPGICKKFKARESHSSLISCGFSKERKLRDIRKLNKKLESYR
ncbi:hypothetical protein KAT92_01235 [Candidatus Babeliales bacterium]|nr:hypothetical protein [Candidatus Babeliales bacterium]